jgi:hypothetical protein
MKTILILLAIAASSYYFYTGTDINSKYVDVMHMYTIKQVNSNNINNSNIEYLTDTEYYILESLKRTNYSFYIIGGWVRDRVSIIYLAIRKRSE